MPKIVFRKMTKKENIEIVKWAFFANNDSLNIYEYTIQCFPDLKSVDKNKETKEEIYNKIEKIVSRDYIKWEKRIISNVEHYNNLWSKYNNLYFNTLCNYLNIEWPEDKEVIDASIGIIPVFPRYLDSFSFCLSTNIEDWKVIETSAHEVLHFAWFEKWKQLYPTCPRKKFDSPYDVWKYSEMVVDPILNSPEFKQIFDDLFEERAYPSFYALEFNGENIMQKLKEIYNQNITIEEKINLGFEYVNDIEMNKQNNVSR